MSKIKNEEYDRIKDYVNSHPGLYLKRDNNGTGWICPICGNGSHKPDSKGLEYEKNDPTHFTCFSGGCVTHADMIEIIVKAEGLEILEFPEQLKRIAEICRLDADNLPTVSVDIKQQKQEKPKVDQSLFYATTREALKNKPDLAVTYLASRGLSIDTAIFAGVGYAENWHSSKSTVTSPRLIFPLDTYSYATRDIRPLEQIPEQNKGFVKQREGTATYGTFRPEALDGSQPVFVTEGEMDALSILEAGYNALSIGSATNASKFLALLEERRASGAHIPYLIVCMDNDSSGQGAASAIKEGLDRLQIEHTIANLAGDYNDPNEAMLQDGFSFSQRLNDVLQEIDIEAEEVAEVEETADADTELPAEKDSFKANTSFKNSFLQQIKGGWKIWSTGIQALDDILDGGLHPELYILGAATGVGKTALSLQIADHIAATYHVPVLYIALEMSRNELIARSISRIASQHVDDKDFKDLMGFSDYEILAGKVSNEEKRLLDYAVKDYFATAGDYVRVVESIANTTLAEAERGVKAIKAETGQAPLLIVDYLQMLPIPEPHMSDMQAIDYNIRTLKRLSRDEKIPVWLISSLNREATKTGKVTAEAAKGSGGIEYTAGVLIGMAKPKDAKASQIDLTVIKKRHGEPVTEDIHLTFCGAGGFFK